jgi:hypothetical protein
VGRGGTAQFSSNGIEELLLVLQTRSWKNLIRISPKLGEQQANCVCPILSPGNKIGISKIIQTVGLDLIIRCTQTIKSSARFALFIGRHQMMRLSASSKQLPVDALQMLKSLPVLLRF